MMRSKGQERKDQTQQQGGGLLTTRILNSLPYADTVKDYYLRKKQANEVLRIGLNLAETCASVAASPFLNKYTAIDRFAAAQLDKLEEQYGDDLVSKSVSAIVFPIGYSLGLAKFAKDKVYGIANPAIELSYEWADVVVDRLMPPDYDETMEDEYRRAKNLRLKSPISILKERTTINSIIHLPANAFALSMDVFSSAAYMTLGLTNLSMERMFYTINALMDSINVIFEEFLEHPWTAINNADVSKIYRATLFYGTRFVNGYIDEVEKLALELREYLDNRNLQYNSQVVGFIADKIKLLERRLIRLGGVITESDTKIQEGTPQLVRSASKPRQRFLMSTPRRIVSPDERLPSMLLAEYPLDQHKDDLHEEEEVHEEELHEEGEWVPSERQVSTEGPKRTRTWAKIAAKKPKTKKPTKHVEVGKPGVFEDVQPSTEEIEEEERSDVDEHGFAPVKATPHHRLTPAAMAKELGGVLLHPEKSTPITPSNTPAENNPYAAIDVAQGRRLGGPTSRSTAASINDQRDLRAKTLTEFMKKVKKQLENDEATQRAERHANLPAWESAKHPVHVHHEQPAAAAPETAAENNPFGKLETETTQDPLSAGMPGM